MDKHSFHLQLSNEQHRFGDVIGTYRVLLSIHHGSQNDHDHPTP